MVTLVFGANSQRLDEVAGLTLGAVKARTADVLNVPDAAEARVDGALVADDYVLKEGDEVEFLKAAGRKG